MSYTDPVIEELRRRQKDCPEGFPIDKWVQMNRKERRDHLKKTKGRRK